MHSTFLRQPFLSFSLRLRIVVELFRLNLLYFPHFCRVFFFFCLCGYFHWKFFHRAMWKKMIPQTISITPFTIMLCLINLHQKCNILCMCCIFISHLTSDDYLISNDNVLLDHLTFFLLYSLTTHEELVARVSITLRDVFF